MHSPICITVAAHILQISQKFENIRLISMNEHGGVASNEN